MKNRAGLLSVATGLLLLTACTSIGARALPCNHLAYNDAVVMTETRELLLNVVRLRYLDPLKFLSVDSVTTSFSVGVGASGTFGQDQEETTALVEPSVRYADTPTLTFTPQGDAKFALNLLSAASLEHVVLALNLSQDVESGLRLLLEEINGARDVPGPRGERFRERARFLGELVAQDRVEFGLVPQREVLGLAMDRSSLGHGDQLAAVKAGYAYEEVEEGKVALVGARLLPGIVVLDASGDRPPPDLTPLGVGGAASVVALRSTRAVGSQAADGRAVYVAPRSVFGLMAVLARGVDVPRQHACGGLVPTLDAYPGTGGPDSLVRIRSGTTRPQDRLSVQHRGHWFWIDDSDQRSKDAFGTLVTFYALKLRADVSEGTRPVLTLPVAR